MSKVSVLKHGGGRVDVYDTGEVDGLRTAVTRADHRSQRNAQRTENQDTRLHALEADLPALREEFSALKNEMDGHREAVRLSLDDFPTVLAEEIGQRVAAVLSDRLDGLEARLNDLSNQVEELKNQ